MTITVNAPQAKELLVDCLKTRLVPMLAGSPGIGKSSIVYEIADEYNLAVIDIRLSQCDPTDLMGFPKIDGHKATYAPMDTFPLETDDLPKGKDGWLLFLDEFNSAPMAVQAAAYKLTLDRQVGQHKLHPRVVIMCAGNLETDNAITNRLSTAMQSRLVHLELEADYKSWIEWAHKSGVDHRITSYIEFKPDSLYKFSPDHNDKTFACPRTWDFVGKLIKSLDEIPSSKLPLLAGTISEGVAREFISFCKVYDELPKMKQIVDSPESIKIPEDPSILYAITGAVAEHSTPETIPNLIKYIKRLPAEFQFITLKATIRRQPKLKSTPAVREWISEAALEHY